MLALLLLQERKLFDVRTLVQIDPTIKTQELIDAKKYAQADEYLRYFMHYSYVQNNPKAQQQMAYIQKVRTSYTYQKNKIIQGIIEGKSDEDLGKFSALMSDFLLIGDIRDLFIEGEHYLNNKEVDHVMVALSSIGLVASASTLYSFGATTPVKGTVSFLKYAKRLGKLPPWLSKELLKESKILKETQSLSSIKRVLTPITQLYEKAGFKGALSLLWQSKNLNNLQSLATFAKRFGSASPTLLKITNNRALYYAKRTPNIDKKTFLYASTYGEEGLRGLNKLGKSTFLRRTKMAANLSKSTYKGNLDSLFDYLLKSLPSSVLIVTIILGLLYFMQRTLHVYQKIKLAT
jgi:hypothetical protein